MCRLFSFRSIIQSQVHNSLLEADNALSTQSKENPDGWGIAHYQNNIPHLIRSQEIAMNDRIFNKVSGIVYSQTIVAHIRKATQGNNDIFNIHPFQFGKWIFAHNGNIKSFEKYKEQIISSIIPELKRFILGTTDSEIIFYFLISIILEKNNFEEEIPYDKLIESLSAGINQIYKIIGPYSIDQKSDQETFLTFILTNGETMVGYNGGKQLYYSTHKVKCPERDKCAYFSEKECEREAPLKSKVNHIVFSSEKIQSENIWLSIKPNEIIGIDKNMTIHKNAL